MTLTVDQIADLVHAVSIFLILAGFGLLLRGIRS